jgi:hypothetical protein
MVSGGNQTFCTAQNSVSVDKKASRNPLPYAHSAVVINTDMKNHIDKLL